MMHAGMVDWFLQQIEQRRGEESICNKMKYGFFFKTPRFSNLFVFYKNEANVVSEVPVVPWTYLWLHSALM